MIVQTAFLLLHLIDPVVITWLANNTVPLQNYGNTQRNFSFLHPLRGSLHLKEDKGGKGGRGDIGRNLQFKTLIGFHRQLGAAGKNTISVFTKASQAGICGVIPFISTASLTTQVRMFCPTLSYNLTVI
jgi:hypothetical protein